MPIRIYSIEKGMLLFKIVLFEIAIHFTIILMILFSYYSVTPISTAAHKGNLEIMSSLIRHGASVNSLNVSGSTALIQVRVY